LLSTSTLSFWMIFFCLLSPILRWKRRASFAPALKAELSAKIALVCVLKKPRLHQACARPSSCAKGVTERWKEKRCDGGKRTICSTTRTRLLCAYSRHTVHAGIDSDPAGLFLAAMHVINSIKEGFAKGG